GDVIVVRWADDFVIGFQNKAEAERCLAELKKRFDKFGLALHPEKTRLVEFGPFAIDNRKRRHQGRPVNIRLLGIHAYMLEEEEQGNAHGDPQDGSQTVAPETSGSQSRTEKAYARADSRTGKVAPFCGRWLYPLLRRAY